MENYRQDLPGTISLRENIVGVFAQFRHANTPTLAQAQSQFIKWVKTVFSYAGFFTPFLLPDLMLSSIQARFSPSVRIVCRPSKSLRTSSGVKPCTIFQYWEPATIMLEMVKYLFRRSKAAVAPPRLHDTTEAASIFANLLLWEKKKRSRKEHICPEGPA